MTLTKSLLDIRKALARRAGIDGGASGDTVSTDLTAVVLNEFINDALYESRDIIIGKWEDYYTVKKDIPVASGFDTIDVPSDFYKLRKVWILESTGRYKRLYAGSLDDAHEYTATTVADRAYRYRIQARALILMPVPTTAESLRVFYIPVPTELVHDTDTVVFDVPVELKLVLAIGWRECLDRQKLDPSPALAKIDAYTKLLRTAADSRDADEPFYLSPHGQPVDEDWAEIW